MNVSKIKTYAIQARRDFIKAVTERANMYGIFSDDHIEPTEFKGDMAIIGGRAFPEKEGRLRQKLANCVKRDGFEMVMRSSAYTWFNRFVALRYMEIHDYLEHGYRVLSNNGGAATPEILEYATDVEFQGLDRDKVIDLRLAGTKDNELYRLLLLSQCNSLHKSMPFLFDRIDSETELLLPDNLLHSDSPIRKMVTEIDESDWEDVEIIGWIYQFYISEHKDEVIGKVVKSEDIPAATQLFTPNWIVKYMVQNTLGRLWLATYPDSPLRDRMEYYIEPAEQESEVQEQLDSVTPSELSPEEITFLDPACGSGHIIVEAYDVFKEIYIERGYRTKDIPRLIIEKNIYGLDICDRAAQLTCLGILMKARADDRRILNLADLKLNVMAIHETRDLNPKDIAKQLVKERVVRFSNNDQLFPDFKGQMALKTAERPEVSREDVVELLELFQQGKTYGSLISIPEKLVTKLPLLVALAKSKLVKGDIFERVTADNLVPIVQQAMSLSRRYDCVVTNPPYMGGNAMNSTVKAFAKRCFPHSKSDLFAMFIQRNLGLAAPHGTVGMITMQSWMFLSSFEKLRELVLNQTTLIALAHLGPRAFDTIGGEVVSTTVFILRNYHHSEYRGTNIRLVDASSETEKKSMMLEAIADPERGPVFLASAAEFSKIPGNPLAYWVKPSIRQVFDIEQQLGDLVEAKQGLATGDNNRFYRFLWEVSAKNVGYGYADFAVAREDGKKWFPINKGGSFRKWYGNIELLISYDEDSRNILKTMGNHLPSERKYLTPSISWSDVTSSTNSFRYFPRGFLFDATGHSAFPGSEDEYALIACYCNSKFVNEMTKILNPTMHFHVGYFNILPYPSKLLSTKELTERLSAIFHRLILIAQLDWDSYETSWGFEELSLINIEYPRSSIRASYEAVRNHWDDAIQETQKLEEENNRILIDSYGLQDDLVPSVPISEITLTCNPYYRYNSNRNEEELETLRQRDAIKELISYAVGCMMGRYSLDHQGIVYAHSSDIEFDPSKHKTFPADDDGIIPIMDQDGFPDDAASRFVEFVKVTWPPENLDENLKFVADNLKHRINETPIDTIRRHLSTTFFKDHLKTYKKRPIYWLFSSGKQRAFECLVYLHRYNESTLSRMRSTYVTPLQGNLSSRLDFLKDEMDAVSTTSAKRKLQKEIDKLQKKQAELSSFDDELRHYADMKIPLDLDDGVKVNYGKFGNLLAEKKAVTGEK